MPTAVQSRNVSIGHVLDHLQQFRVLAEKFLPCVPTGSTLVVLVFTINRFVHPLLQQTQLILLKQGVPHPPPNNFDHIPASAAEYAFKLLDDLAVTSNRTIQALQIAVNDENEIVQLLSPRQRDRALRLRLIHFSISGETPDLSILHLGKPPAIQVLHNVRLINRLERPQPH